MKENKTYNKQDVSIVLGGRGRREASGEGEYNEKSFFNTPSSVLRTSSPSRGEETHGFTLVELLVVVLIIGILAAVALPQYQKAVEKSRLAEAEIILKSIREAQQRCILEQGGFNYDICGTGDPERENLFTTMDIDLPFPRATDSVELLGADPCLQGKNFYYCLEGNGYICAYRVNGEDYVLTTSANPTAMGYNYIFCGGDDCSKIGYTATDSFGGKIKP